MKKLMLFTAATGLLLLMSCQVKQNFSPLEFHTDSSFELPYKDTGHCSCGNLAITFTDVVEDVYRPAWMEGVEEGQVRARFNVQADNISQSIELVYRASRSSFDRDTVGGYAISLMRVSPHLRMGQTAEKSNYRVRLMVEELP